MPGPPRPSQLLWGRRKKNGNRRGQGRGRRSPSPQVTAPQSGAVVDSDTEFAWSVPEGAIRYMYAYGDNTPFTMMIASASSQARLPDLSPLGLDLAPGTTWSWHGDFDQGPRSMDEFAAGGCQVRGWGASEDQSFTVGP